MGFHNMCAIAFIMGRMERMCTSTGSGPNLLSLFSEETSILPFFPQGLCAVRDAARDCHGHLVVEHAWKQQNSRCLVLANLPALVLQTQTPLPRSL